MSKKIRSFLSILLAVVMAVSSLVVVSAATASSDSDVQAVVDAIVVDNETTQADVEAAITAAFADAQIAWTQAFYKEMATPTVEVKLLNATNGAYDVYYTAEGHTGLVSGIVAVTIGENTFTAYLYKTILPAVEEILCDSKGEVTYDNAGTKTVHTGTEDLIVYTPGSDNVVVVGPDTLSAETRANVKAIVVEGSIARVGNNSNASLEFTKLQGFFAKNHTVRNNDFFIDQFAFKNATALKYVDFGTFNNTNRAGYLNFAYGGFANTAIEYLYLDFPGYNIKTHDGSFRDQTALKQIVINADGFQSGNTNSFRVNNLTIVAKTAGMYEALTTTYKPANATVKVLNAANGAIQIDSSAALQAVLNGIAVNNDTTKASIESVITGTCADAQIVWAQDLYKEMATPAVDVKLLNTETGEYEVYYTSNGHNGLISGMVSVTTGGKTFGAYIYKEIAFETEEILCDTKGNVTYDNGGTKTVHTGTEDLIVYTPGDDNVVVVGPDTLSAETRANVKAIVVEGSIARVGNNSNASLEFTKLQGFFAKNHTVRNNDFFIDQFAFKNATALKYVDFGTFKNTGRAGYLNFAYGGFANTAIEYLYLDFPGYNIKTHDGSFRDQTALKQIVINADGFQSGNTNSFRVNNLTIVAKTAGMYEALTTTYKPANATVKVIRPEDAEIKGIIDAAIQAKVDAITVNNDTTEASFEADLRAAFEDVSDIIWNEELAVMEAVPQVKVMLFNGETVNGETVNDVTVKDGKQYDVYYTSESYAGSATGSASVLIGGTMYVITVNQIIKPNTEYIYCDTIDEVTYTDNGYEYAGIADLLVIKGRSDGVAALKAADLTYGGESPLLSKVVIVDGKLTNVEAKVFTDAPNLIGVFAKQSTGRSDNFLYTGSFGSTSADIESKLKYIYLGKAVITDNRTNALNFAYQFAQNATALEYVVADFGATTVKVHSNTISNTHTPNLRQFVVNCSDFAKTDAEAFYKNGLKVVIGNETAYNTFAATAQKADVQVFNKVAMRAEKSLAETAEILKTEFPLVNDFTNTTGTETDKIKAAVTNLVPADVTVTLEAADFIAEKAVNGGIVTYQYEREYTDAEGAEQTETVVEIVTATRTAPGKVTAYATLTKDGSSVIVPITAPIYSTYAIVLNATSKAEYVSEETHKEFTDPKTEEVRDSYDVIITGIQTQGELLIIDGADESFNGKAVYINDNAFDATTNEFKAVVVRNAGVGKYAFANNTQLLAATFGQGVKFPNSPAWEEQGYAYQNTFAGCTALTYAGYADGITVIGREEFLNASALTGFVIPSTVKFVHYAAFKSAKVMVAVYVDPASKAKFDAPQIFNGCVKLYAVRIPEGTTKIYDNTFTNDGLNTLIIPSTVTSVVDKAFVGAIPNIKVVNYSNLTYRYLETMIAKNRVPVKLYSAFASDFTSLAKEKNLNYATIGDINADAVVNVLDLITLKQITLNESDVYDITLDIDGDGANANAADILGLKKVLVNKNTATYNYVSTVVDKAAEDRKEAIINSDNTVVEEGATVYYVDAVNGSDDNAGTEDAPFQTLAKASQYSGTVDNPVYVLLKRGCVWREQLVAKSNTVYGSYGEGAKPAIYASPEDGGTDTAKWTSIGNNIWKYSTKMSEVGGLVLDAGSGYEIYGIKYIPHLKNGALYPTSTSSNVITVANQATFKNFLTTEGQFLFVPDDPAKMDEGDLGTLYFRCGAGKNPAERYGSIEFMTRERGIIADDVQNVIIDNITVKYSGSHGIQISGNETTCTNVTVSNCVIGWMGGCIQLFNNSGVATRFGNGIEAYLNITGFTVENCYVYECYDAAMTHQAGNTYADVAYRNNITERCAYGVEYFTRDTDANGASSQTNIVIDGNIFRLTGVGHTNTRTDKYAAAIRTNTSTIYNNNVTGFVISNNVFDRSATYMFLIFDGDTADLPVFENNTVIQYATDASYNKNTALGVISSQEQVDAGFSKTFKFDLAGDVDRCIEAADITNFFLIHE